MQCSAFGAKYYATTHFGGMDSNEQCVCARVHVRLCVCVCVHTCVHVQYKCVLCLMVCFSIAL